MRGIFLRKPAILDNLGFIIIFNASSTRGTERFSLVTLIYNPEEVQPNPRGENPEIQRGNSIDH